MLEWEVSGRVLSTQESHIKSKVPMSVEIFSAIYLTFKNICLHSFPACLLNLRQMFLISLLVGLGSLRQCHALHCSLLLFEFLKEEPSEFLNRTERGRTVQNHTAFFCSTGYQSTYLFTSLYLDDIF